MKRLLWGCCTLIALNACTQDENTGLRVERAKGHIVEYGAANSLDSPKLLELRENAARAALELTRMCLTNRLACNAVSINLEPGLAEMVQIRANELSIRNVEVIVENDAQRILDVPLDPVFEGRRIAILLDVTNQRKRVSLAEMVN